MRTQKQKQRFLFLYRIYFIASLIPLAVFLQLTAYFYLSAFREYVTISHLFLLALLLGFTMYLRNDAFHYQLLLVQLEKNESKDHERPKKGTSKNSPKEEDQEDEKAQKKRKKSVSDRSIYRNHQ